MTPRRQSPDRRRASQVLNRRRALTLPVIRRLAARPGLSLALLTQEYPLAPEAVAEQADFRSGSGIAQWPGSRRASRASWSAHTNASTSTMWPHPTWSEDWPGNRSVHRVAVDGPAKPVHDVVALAGDVVILAGQD